MAVLRYLGLAEEGSYNPDVAPQAAFHVDIASATLDVPGEAQMIYGGGLNRSAYLHRPGFYAPSGNIVYAMDIRTIAFLLKWALGGYKFTAGDPNLHEIWGSSDSFLPSFCARLGKDLFEHVFHGCGINSLQIQVEGEFVLATAEIIAAKDSRADIKDVTDLLLPDEYPLAFHEVTAKLGGTAVGDDKSADIKSLTININNNLSAEDGRGIGSRHPYRLPAGERELTISKQLWYEDIEQLQTYRGGNDGPANAGTTETELHITIDSGEFGNLVMSLPRFVYTNVQQQPSGRDELVQSTEGRAFMTDQMLDDGTTEISTDAYVQVNNDGGEI